MPSKSKEELARKYAKERLKVLKLGRDSRVLVTKKIIADYLAGYAAGLESESEKTNNIINYCRTHINQMWAAQIVAELLGCDFRDAQSAIEAFQSKIGGAK